MYFIFVSLIFRDKSHQNLDSCIKLRNNIKLENGRYEHVVIPIVVKFLQFYDLLFNK